MKAETANPWEMSGLVRWLRMPALLTGCYAILLTGVLLGLITSGTGPLPRLGSQAELGLGSNRVGIEPLTDRFVDRALGRGAAPAPETKPDRRGAPQPDIIGRATDDVGEVVDHALTNDDQGNAYEVTRLPFTGRTSTSTANREGGEPECGPALGGTVWYRYTAPLNASLLADTFGTGYQTSLAGYRQGPRGPEQLEHACDFDSQGNSQIKVDVILGTTYLLQVGAAATGGDLTFNLRRFGETTLESVSPQGRSGNAHSSGPSVSYDGRYVAFDSQATDLVPEGEARECRHLTLPTKEACYNVFLRDRQLGTVSLVSVGLDGKAANESSIQPQVSDDGRYVLFHSNATNLVAGDTNDVFDAFVRDMRTGRTERVSLSERSEQLRPGPIVSSTMNIWNQSGVTRSSMSADGRYVAFMSRSPNLVRGDKDEFWDVFVRDRLAGTTRVVSLDDRGGRSPLGVSLQSLSRNGNWIVLLTDVPMTEDDADLSQDVFVRDLSTGSTERISVPEAGHEIERNRDASGTNSVSQRSISDDGRYVVFGSDGALVDGDTNGVLDVFVRDRLQRRTERVSVSSTGEEGLGTSNGAHQVACCSGNPDWSISGDGRVVAFSTDLNFLEPSDGNIANDVFVRDRIHSVTVRISRSGRASTYTGSYSPQISGDGMHTAFYSYFPLSRQDQNLAADVYVFSPLPAEEKEAPLARASIPTVPCKASSEYSGVGPAGVHENVSPSLIMAGPLSGLEDLGQPTYPEASTVRLRYRIDFSGSSKNPFAQTAAVGFELRWDNGLSDYDFYIYDANGRLLTPWGGNGGTGNLNNGDLSSGDFHGQETDMLVQVRHCMDLRVDIVNYMGLPPDEMTLDIRLGDLK